jgi:hypothetical protein
MDLIYTLFPFVKQGEPAYITNIPVYFIHLNLQLSNTIYIGRIGGRGNGLPNPVLGVTRV